jgi:hypothetical protein
MGGVLLHIVWGTECRYTNSENFLGVRGSFIIEAQQAATRVAHDILQVYMKIWISVS